MKGFVRDVLVGWVAVFGGAALVVMLERALRS